MTHEGDGVARPIPDVTVIVPTRNESGNVVALLDRLSTCLAGRDAEVLFVDDSDDDTPEVARHYRTGERMRVRVLHREGRERAGGLGSAVLAGLRMSEARWAVVMDGDLQHPPETVSDLVATGDRESADVVVATRYIVGGDAGGLSSAARVWVSGSATRLAKAVFPARLSGCSDPMSGFFAVRRGAVDLDALHPHGFKVLLEILARSPRLRIAECGFTFAERSSGRSKASWREGALYVRRLLALRIAAWRSPRVDRIARIIAFGAVGLSGMVVNSAALWALVDLMSVPLLIAATIATQISTLWNFLLTDVLVFRGYKRHNVWVRLLGFALINNAVLLGRLPVLYWLVHAVHMGYLLANILTLLAAFAVRYVVSDRILFARREPTMFDSTTEAAASGGGRRRTGPVDLVVDVAADAAPRVFEKEHAATWRYDIHGLVHVASVVRLSELDRFAVDDAATAACPDIEIHGGRLADGRMRMRTRVVQSANVPAVAYYEHLGRLGSDFCVDMSDMQTASDGHPAGAIHVTAGPLLLRSPHVLYTNVVEALLRFVLVSRGHILLHSACLELNGHGVMLSALTDTGKTGTILRLLRENDSRFLSDDMTVLTPDGVALSYPKPMTISQHTLRAVNAGDLSPAEWRKLRVQSRLHSKEGRSVGAWLGRMNLPIMSVNAITQWVVPPPKYDVARLVPCRHSDSVRVEELFIIARGESQLSDLDDRESLLDELIANTDDAYGFPPFAYFAPALAIGTDGYEELRAKERIILASAMRAVRARRLVTPDFSWADRIPALAMAGVRPVAPEPHERTVSASVVAASSLRAPQGP